MLGAWRAAAAAAATGPAQSTRGKRAGDGRPALCSDLRNAFPGEQGCLERLLTKMSGGFDGDLRSLGWSKAGDGGGPCRGQLRRGNGSLLRGRVQLVPMQELNSPWGRFAQHLWGAYDGSATAARAHALRVAGVWDDATYRGALHEVAKARTRFECRVCDHAPGTFPEDEEEGEESPPVPGGRRGVRGRAGVTVPRGGYTQSK